MGQMIGKMDTKGGNGQIRVHASEYKGKRYVDIRVYFPDEYGEWQPTKKGITFPCDDSDTLIEHIEEAKRWVN